MIVDPNAGGDSFLRDDSFAQRAVSLGEFESVGCQDHRAAPNWQKHMTRLVDIEQLYLAEYLKPGDRIIIGQACGEPVSLVVHVIAQGRQIDGLSAFIGSSFSGLFGTGLTHILTLSSMGAIGTLRAVAAAGELRIVPLHASEIEAAIATGALGCDVAMIQVSAADDHGNYSCGAISDHVCAAVSKAKVVIAEVNEAAPCTKGETIHASQIDVLVPVNRPLPQVPTVDGDAVSDAVAGYCATFIGDGAVIQAGVGSLPDAILGTLSDRKDLGVHSGMIGDGFAALVEAGAITNARKEIDRGVSITGALVGTDRLYRLAHRNPAIRMCPASYTHDAGVIARLSRFVAINTALEVDLTGQVNSESVGGTYLGATGGLADFTRGASRSPQGRALVVLPATASGGSRSRIVAKLSGPATIPRSDADVIVTEFGAARLKGCSLAERASRLVEIAHPDFREELSRSAHAIARQGF